MRIAVIGATGRTGLAFVGEAHRRRHEVVAVVRNPDRLTVDVSSVERADARSPAELAAAIRGVDAVVFCVGPGPDAPHGIVTEAITSTIEAMHTAGIARLLMITATGPFTDGDAPLLKYVLKPVVQRILRAPFADLAAADAIVQASDLDWTIVRPPQLADGRARGSYRRDPSWGLRITRTDLAVAMADALEDRITLNRVVSVAN